MRRLLAFLYFICLAQLSNAQLYRNEWIDFNKTYYRFPVRAEGIYRITKASLQNIGLADVPVQYFQLWRQGKEIPLFTTEASGPLANTGYLEFFGRPNDGTPDTDLYLHPTHQARTTYSLFTDTALYYLTVNSAGPNLRRFSATNGVNQTNLLPDKYFFYHYIYPYFEQFNGGYAQFGPDRNLPGEVFWTGYNLRSSQWDKGEGYCSPGFSNWFPLTTNVPALRAYTEADAPPFSVKYNISGGFGGAGFENSTRTLLLSVNDTLIDSKFINGFEQYITEKNNIPASRILSDGLRFHFTTDQPYYWDASFINSLEVKYARRFHFGGQRNFSFQLAASTTGHHLRIAGFNHGNAAPLLIDETNNLQYTGVLKGDSVLFALPAHTNIQQYTLASLQPSAITVVSQFTQVQFRDYRQAALQWDYLIISHPVLYNHEGINPVEAYQQYRSSPEGGGYRAQVYNMDELAEQFAYGIKKHPLAIRNFLRYALAHFEQKPKFVLLLGRASAYTAYTANRSRPEAQFLNSVPTWGMPGSDQLLAATTPGNPTPAIPIGRVAAISGAEVANYLQKIKKYETLVNQGTAVSQKQWQKDMMLLAGGDDTYVLQHYLSFFNQYKNILQDTALGARVNIYSRPNNPNFPQDMLKMNRTIDSGVGLIGYFGHSSSSSIDFNLSNPNALENAGGKLPVFMAYGCRAGNIFDYDATRLITRFATLSDNYLFTPAAGAIAFIANADNVSSLNPPSQFNSNWYKAAAQTHYGKSLGEIHREAIRKSTENRNLLLDDPFQFQFIINSEQTILHGDPALTPFPALKPDFAVSDGQIHVQPLHPTVANDSILIKAYYNNLGRYTKAPVSVTIAHINPFGQQKLLLRKTVNALPNIDSLTVKASLKGLVDAGENKISITIDPDIEFDEVTRVNNHAEYKFIVDSGSAIPVFPYPFAIVNWPAITLTASTANALAPIRQYLFEIDTTARFNSTLKVSSTVQSAGGAVSTQPTGITYEAGRVYYWRVAPLVAGIPMGWQQSSFIYMPGTETGFNQSHFFQHQANQFIKFTLDSISRRFHYGDSLHSFYINHGIYPTSATEDSHFSLTVNGNMISASACVGASLIFNVFDGVTFKPWSNASGGRFGSGPNCGPGRAYNFEFRYFPHPNRKLIMDFLDSIPKGNWVVVRMVVDPPADSMFMQYWQRDTLVYGSGKSLYHMLKSQGFYNIDSVNRGRTFGFVFKKDDSQSYTPQVFLSDGYYDRETASAFPVTPLNAGAMTSPWMGPAAQWKTMLWDKFAPAAGKPDAENQIYLRGKKADGTTQLLRLYNNFSKVDDISNISAQTYPYLQFEMRSSEPLQSEATQLDYWRLYYEPVPDGAISAADYFMLNKDTLVNNHDVLQMAVAFKNISRYWLAGTHYKIWLGNSLGEEQLIQSGTLKALGQADTAIFSASLPILNMGGRYYLRLVVNQERQPTEQHYFNNTAYLPFFVLDNSLPATLLQFDAVPVGHQVQTHWQVEVPVGIKQYVVQHSTDGRQYHNLTTVVPNASAQTREKLTYLHTNPALGTNYYRLQVKYHNGNTHFSAVRLVKFGNKPGVYVYPNPIANIAIVQPTLLDGSYELQIFNNTGQRMHSQKAAGTIQINTTAWPAGMYLFRVMQGKHSFTQKIEKHQ
ncbi:MAG TPA: C25 family cysteine peptidase [Phnomibacter sp.]|nr:C25 family cysteine peptidase [Phnomibacter sp.]